jgi:hypothetical protein
MEMKEDTVSISRDINTSTCTGIAEEIVALNDGVADVDADAKSHLLTGTSISILLGYGVLHLDTTLRGIHGAGEVGKHAIARRVEDPTVMRGKQAIDDDPVAREGAKGADLILPRQAAIAFDIRREYRRELSFDPVGFQRSAPPRSSIARPDARSEGCKPF